MQSAWVAACDVNNINIKTSFICEKHFTEDSYKQDLVNELLDRPVQKLLKWDAIPTINVPFVVTAIKPISTESVDQGNLLTGIVVLIRKLLEERDFLFVLHKFSS